MGEGRILRRDLARDYPVLVRGEGVYVWDEAGRRYLDATSGISVSCVGHGNARVAEALRRQAMTLAYATSGYFANVPAMRLAERIGRLTPGDLHHLFFTTGGSEAVETAIKLARRYHLARGNAGKYLVIGRWASYHGATAAALSAGGHAPRRQTYTPYLLSFPHVVPAYCYRCPFGLTYPSCGLACAGDLEREILRAGPENVAAFIAEPIVGAAAGALVPPDGYFEQIRATCDRYDVLFIADEVITGFGRTGRFFAMEHWPVVPDMMAVAKGMSGGYAPLGAVVVSDRIGAVFQESMASFAHGFTYSDHPLSCAAALEVLDIIEEDDLVAGAARLGEYLLARLEELRQHPAVGDVRGRGLLAGIELVQDQASREPFPAQRRVADRLFALCLERGLIIYPGGGMVDGHAGDQFLLCPPYIVTRSQIDDLVTTLDDALSALEHEL